MLKKIFIFITMFLSESILSSFAGSIYLGPALTYFNINAHDQNFDGVSPAFYLGYGNWMWQCLYLAIEGFIAFEPFNHHNNNNNNLLKPEITYGFSLIPGVNLDNTLLGYARLGYVKTSFKNGDNSDKDRKRDRTRHAYQVGVGLEAPINLCWSIRLEYVYTPYKNSIHSNQATLGLIYRFEPILEPIGYGL